MVWFTFDLYFFISQIIFDFANQIDAQLEASLNELGIEVRINGEFKSKQTHDDECNITKLNLDVTTIMAYISSLTCGNYNWEFNEPILTEQAIKESLNPVKIHLDELFQGKIMWHEILDIILN